MGETQNKPLHYENDKQIKGMCNVMSHCEFESNVDDEYMYPMAVEQELADKQYPLDVSLFRTNQGLGYKATNKSESKSKVEQ
jgi:hypothetical protein